VRIGQEKNRTTRGEGVGPREFQGSRRNVELGIRNIKIALRRPAQIRPHRRARRTRPRPTIKETANHGYLDVLCVGAAHAVKVLVFFDIGGSMDSHIEQVGICSLAAKSEFKHMEYFYFHTGLMSCGANKPALHRPHADLGVLHKYPHDYKVVFVGDRLDVWPYEIMVPRGRSSTSTEELDRFLAEASRAPIARVWLNPVAQKHWDYSESTTLIVAVFERMYPSLSKVFEGAMRNWCGCIAVICRSVFRTIANDGSGGCKMAPTIHRGSMALYRRGQCGDRDRQRY